MKVLTSKYQPYPTQKTYLVVLKIVWCAYVGGSWMSFSGKKTFYHQQIRVKRRNHANFERDDNVPVATVSPYIDASDI